MAQEFTEFARNLSPDIYRDLKRSLELGRWPDGRTLSPEQRELCMEAIISYEAAHLPEQERTGYMEQACKSEPRLRAEDNINITQLNDDA